MKISACYIVKNEADHLGRSIESLKNACDEIIVVDTGSTDETAKIAETLGARVYPFEWTDDFSKARNYALSHATGDLIIFLDADEWFANSVSKESFHYIEQKIKEGYQVFTVPFCNVDGDTVTPPMFLNRIYRNHVGIQYKNPIHETLTKTDHVLILPEAFTVYHSGYAKAVLDTKVRRNLELLHKELKAGAWSVRKLPIYFYLARESGFLGESKEAYKYIGEFFKRYRKKDLPDTMAGIAIAAHCLRIAIALLHPVKGVSSALCRQYVDEFLRDYPKHPTAYYHEAEYYYKRMGDLENAKKSLEKMDKLQKGYRMEQYPNDISALEMYTAKVFQLKAKIHYAYGEMGEAFDCAVQALQNGDFDDEVFRILLQVVRGQNPSEITAFISAVKTWTAEEIEKILMQLIYFPPLKDVYLYFAMQHMRMTRQRSDITAIASFFSDDYEQALKVARDIRETERVSSDTLLCAALFLSDDQRIMASIPGNQEWAGRLMNGYFSGIPLSDLSLIELDLLARISKIMLFLGRDEKTRKMLRLLDLYPYERFLILFNYYRNAEAYVSIIASLDFDPDTIQKENAANCYYALGQAHTGLKQYGQALEQYEKALKNYSEPKDIERNLRTLVSLAPEYKTAVTELMELRENQRKITADSKTATVINAVFGGEKKTVSISI